TDHAERGTQPFDDVLDLERGRERQRGRREHARRVPGMDARLLDVLHHGADVDVLAVAERVDVELDRVLHEAVDKHRALDGGHRRPELLVVAADAHGATAEDVRGPDEDGIADLPGGRTGFLERRDRGPRRTTKAELTGQRAEALAVLRE